MPCRNLSSARCLSSHIWLWIVHQSKSPADTVALDSSVVQVQLHEVMATGGISQETHADIFGELESTLETKNSTIESLDYEFIRLQKLYNDCIKVRSPSPDKHLPVLHHGIFTD